MSFSKALCVLCECPTADGAVLAVHVDKDKLQHWALNVCGHEFAHEIDDQDKICYFCVWQAELNWKFDGMADEEMVWWPRNEDFDDAAKELRKHYFEGRLEQCWVQLETIELPKCAEVEKKAYNQPVNQARKKCIYCGRQFKYSTHLFRHTKLVHPEAIRCQNHRCATYFHTLEERDSHQKEVHEKPKERRMIKCNFCVKDYEGADNYNNHVRRSHREFPVKCSHRGCRSFFKTKGEMKTHFDLVHGHHEKDRKFKCNECGMKSFKKHHLAEHIAKQHFPRCAKCTICGKLFSTDKEVRDHVKYSHNVKVCTHCETAVSVGTQCKHLEVKNCRRCKKKFKCSGLLQMHKKSCKETLFKCGKCPKAFRLASLLKYHTKRQHRSD